jgi:hypothetical protein
MALSDRMTTPPDLPAERPAPKTRVGFGAVFIAVLLVGNLLLLAAEYLDRSWGAVQMVVIVGPMLNVALMISGLVAIPHLKRLRAQFSLGRHLAMTLGLPLAAVAIAYANIISMFFREGLHF